MFSYTNLFLLFAIFVGTFFTVTVGMDIPYSNQSALLSEIRNVSSIIFGVTGAWLALVYPKALSSVDLSIKTAKDDDYKQAENDNNVLLGFIKTIIISIIVIALGVLIPFAKEFLSIIIIPKDIHLYLKGILFYVIVLLALIQFYLLFETFSQTKKALREVKKQLAKAKTKNERSHNSNH